MLKRLKNCLPPLNTHSGRDFFISFRQTKTMCDGENKTSAKSPRSFQKERSVGKSLVQVCRGEESEDFEITTQ